MTPASGGRDFQAEAGVHDDPAETTFDRCVSIVGKALRLVAYLAIVYALLTLGFFLCCGVDPILYASPFDSPFGPAVTILLVWPVLGLLCLALWGVGFREVLKTADKGLRGLVRGLRPPGDP